MLAGTIFHGTRTPLTVWFEAAWLLMVSKQGLSALELQRACGLGSYQTAWTMLHKFRHAMTETGRDRLIGDIEVDETYFGGVAAGKRGRGAGGKTLVVAAVERRGTGFGRIRMRVIDAATEASLSRFLIDVVEPGSTVVTDGWMSYPPATKAAGVDHQRLNVHQSGLPAHNILPGVHRVFALAKRMIEGTYQDGVQPAHLQAYLDEFVFRFNRRTSRHRGLLFLRLLENAVQAPPIGYRQLVATRTATARHRRPPGGRTPPATLETQNAHRPWRAAA